MTDTDLLDGLTNTVTHALLEDIGNGDVTAQLIAKDTHITATIISREPCVLCGTPWVNEVFNQLAYIEGSPVAIEWRYTEGESCKANTTICKLSGNARTLLTGERTALNFLQTLSGTATTTRLYVDELSDTDCKILDTRKTIPGLRRALKYAVTTGGGTNHRIGLYDQFLIKENHIAACGSISKAVTLARHNHPQLRIEVETESLDELREALAAGADIIMLDNYDLHMMKQAVTINNGQSALEVSGNVTLDSIKSIARTGVDYISSGDLTKNLRSIDFSMRFQT